MPALFSLELHFSLCLVAIFCRISFFNNCVGSIRVVEGEFGRVGHWIIGIGHGIGLLSLTHNIIGCMGLDIGSTIVKPSLELELHNMLNSSQ